MGSATLSSGIDIMPAIVGLFAFAQGLELSSSKAQETIGGNSKLSWNIWPKFDEIKRVKYSLLRGWGCGLVLGIIPAAGGSIAQWIAYAWEIQKGKIGDQFGKGEIKGLAATEASNNGCTGTSLIPMYFFSPPLLISSNSSGVKFKLLSVSEISDLNSVSITHLNSHSINLTIIKLALNYTVLTYF